MSMPFAGVHVALPVLLIGVPLFLLAAAIARRVTFYRQLVDSEIAANRYHSVDGLRGFLALGVAFHHVAMNYQYYQTGLWRLTSTHLGTFLGKGSVAFFFMITAFLFWNRAMDENGHLDAYRFYRSRLRRIVPMYLVAALLAIVTALIVTGGSAQVPLTDLTRSALAWLFFTFPGALSINGFEQSLLINTVFWSLVWEWKFYFILPFLAMFSGPRYRWHLAVVVGVLLWFFDTTSFGWFFLGGAVTAMATRFRLMRTLAQTSTASFVAIACIAAAVVYAPWAYDLMAATLLLVAFTIFAGGNTLFGVLTCRPARFLGILSYSIYLLHNWLVFVISRVVDRYFPIGELPEVWYWFLGGGVVLLTVGVASITYRFIESPYLRSTRGRQKTERNNDIEHSPQRASS